MAKESPKPEKKKRNGKGNVGSSKPQPTHA